MLEPTPADGDLPPRLLQDTAATFGLLSAPVRLHILWLLANGDQDVGTLADKTGQSLATVSHHLSKLKLAGLVRAQRHGKRQVYVATDPRVLTVIRAAVGGQADPDLPLHIRHA
ncbi:MULTISPECIES: helix-turn-helix transcriptional regulator [unclassified Mycolicibacterium]|uniref:ArsR/SmtB family transcription factor n=1 Tax=unclassified Mycolicibacterium TaxID=2636767 RepID=UPI001309AD55|nr:MULTISPECIES: metalloregulator ArsR/SmtB family transcription factor [unclassified Mycolicibacterium]MUL84936.1 winged helix-turn-helix transcriptional regulator [Mycolicibacterium sp. CBMA 329]MUL90903.1 winged helix-turn-helix transcriptional regulator [Mycolicibacterium sp. CBMA 331]MUL98426.1 winged helix-turn-helix transcriptional regulator [Mycolicibacterium sp. CBMA 334]MUM27950.1 winged helix-turn-helix transcriptional regulator [Mycolicibacterium sp. CBMA 295]MUM40662.1 winged heli